MKIKYSLIYLLFLSCSDLFISNENYNAIYLDGGSWMQIENDGTNEYPYSINALNNEFTLEFWISNSVINSNDSPFLFLFGSKLDNNDFDYQLGMSQNINKPNSMRLYIDNYVHEFEIENLNWTEEEIFYNLVFVYDTSFIQIFIDGVLKKQISTSSYNIDFSNCDLFIGAKGFKDYPVLPTNFWSGYFDEIRIWKKALSNIVYFTPSYNNLDINNTTSVSNENITFIDADDNGISECLLTDSWESNSIFYQEIDLSSINTLYLDGSLENYDNCICYNQGDGTYDCWDIITLVEYHNLYPEQTIANYGDPLIDELISLLKFNKFPSNAQSVIDESGNYNDALIYSLPGYEAEFVEIEF
tara:strand:+ start:759 stop:1832 length:1074 start_codon:yes stop_codon:yes gene_type:complete